MNENYLESALFRGVSFLFPGIRAELWRVPKIQEKVAKLNLVYQMVISKLKHNLNVSCQSYCWAFLY